MKLHLLKILFDDKNDLKKFVKSCDIIIHLAAKNRDKRPKYNLRNKFIFSTQTYSCV